MKKLLMLILSIGLLGLPSFGQTMTVKQQKAFNAKAKWVEVARSADTNEPLLVDSTDIGRINKDVVLYRVKWINPKDNAYATVIGHCVNFKYLFTNAFQETRGVLKKHAGISKVIKAEKDSVMYAALVYACREAVEIPIMLDNH